MKKLAILALVSGCAISPRAATDKVEEAPSIIVESDSCSLGALSAFFDTNSTEVVEADHASLNAIADCLNGPLSNISVELVGHADTRGSKRKNHLLSRDRAHQVARYLAGQGVEAERIRISAVGEIAAIEGHNMARRVDIRLLDCSVDHSRSCADL